MDQYCCDAAQATQQLQQAGWTMLNKIEEGILDAHFGAQNFHPLKAASQLLGQCMLPRDRKSVV